MIGTVFMTGATLCLLIALFVGVYLNLKFSKEDPMRGRWVRRAKVWLVGAALFLVAWVIQALFKM